ncbi:reverse transcriptase domain-containing protein [Tanacetum coccineum]
MEEISHVLWAHRTMIKSSNGDTPFSLTYGTEAVIPAEIGMPTFRTAEVDVAKNDEALKINLELLEENFKPGDLVYRNNEASHAEDTGKLGPKWEGPYEVTEALGKGSYRLKERNGKELPRTWNFLEQQTTLDFQSQPYLAYDARKPSTDPRQAEGQSSKTSAIGIFQSKKSITSQSTGILIN